MSIEMYNALLLAVKEEVCSSLCLAGFGDLDSMLKALNMSRSDRGVKEVVVKEVKKEEVKKEESSDEEVASADTGERFDSSSGEDSSETSDYSDSSDSDSS